jgi:hypothetical protein
VSKIDDKPFETDKREGGRYVMNTSSSSTHSSERRPGSLTSDLETQPNVKRIFHGIYSAILN